MWASLDDPYYCDDVSTSYMLALLHENVKGFGYDGRPTVQKVKFLNQKKECRTLKIEKRKFYPPIKNPILNIWPIFNIT